MRIKVKDYEKFVVGMVSPEAKATEMDKLLTMGLGLGGEAGEVVDIVKKVKYHGLKFDDSVKEKLVKELGDLLFYVTFAASEICGMDLKEVMAVNQNKLLDRHKGTFQKGIFEKKDQ